MTARTLVGPIAERRTYRELLFLLSAAPLAVIWFGLFLGGWLATGLLAVTPLLVPVLLAFRTLTWAGARVEARLARALLGVAVELPAPGLGAKGYWGRIRGVVSDARWWREQAYLFARMVLGGGEAVAATAALGVAAWWISLPLTYRWADDSFGSWHVDRLSRALPFLPAGLVALVVAGWLIRLLAASWRPPARLLLGPGSTAVPASLREALRRALPYHGAGYAVLSLVLVAVWAATAHAYFWPEWTLLPLGLLLALHGLAVVAPQRRLGLALHAGSSVAVGVFLVAVWAVTGARTFWPVWPLLALALVVAIHVGALLLVGGDRAALSRRIDVLTATRAGAVDASEAELRRIERDLHDGAQARLVALGMSLGLAEQKLASDPDEARQLLAEARVGAGEALRELRDLARGIHPPILADRGLGAALGALAATSPLPVELAVDVEDRPPEPIEAAAYFVAAEALANAAKHADASRIQVSVARNGALLTVEVVDDGAGGARADGPGLTGLRHRVEALDGSLTVTSPPGGPTSVKAAIPCAS